jgi:hypothetical protein
MVVLTKFLVSLYLFGKISLHHNNYVWLLRVMKSLAIFNVMTRSKMPRRGVPLVLVVLLFMSS